MPRKQVINSSKSYEKDVKAIQDAESGKKPLDLSAFKRLMVHDLCSNTNILNSMKIGAYSIEKIQDALQNPRSHSSILLETSRYLMNVSPFYMRINNYFSKMGLFNYVIDVYDLKVDELNTEEKQKKLRDTYFAVCSEFEKINLKHEMLKIMETIVPEDVFYGLIFEDSTKHRKRCDIKNGFGIMCGTRYGNRAGSSSPIRNSTFSRMAYSIFRAWIWIATTTGNACWTRSRTRKKYGWMITWCANAHRGYIMIRKTQGLS